MEESIKKEIKKFLKEVEGILQIIENKAKMFYEKGPPDFSARSDLAKDGIHN